MTNRDDGGRFAEGNTPENAFPPGYTPTNICPRCGQASELIDDAPAFRRYNCKRCELKWVKDKFTRFANSNNERAASD